MPRSVLYTALLAMLSACGSVQPLPIPTNDLKSGPGLFSGPTGQFDLETCLPIDQLNAYQDSIQDLYRLPLEVPES